MKEVTMRSKEETQAYLSKAEQNAIQSMARGKWMLFGYWAAMAVHLRRVLKVSHTASRFREFKELAESMINVPKSQQ